MILVKGDPTRDINATRAITRIWRGGHEFGRNSYRDTQQANTTMTEQRNWFVAEIPSIFAPGIPDIVP